MRHVFVINPLSGKGKGVTEFIESIKSAAAQAGIIPEIYAEPDREGMMEFMRAAASSGEPVRIYACGGDGTVFCAVNATYGCENVQIAAIPRGSGNDFIRLFGDKDELQDISRHINGTPHWIDAIECGEDVSINICSMGFDAEINAMQATMKKIPWLKGDAAYTVAGFYCLLRKFHNVYTIQIDDNPPVTGAYMFAIGGNSRWYGGGFKSCPHALPDDGLLDCITVKKAFGRLRLAGLINKYKAGEHLEWDFTSMQRGKVMRVHCDSPAAVNIDGEIRMSTDAVFALKEKAVCYVVPKGSDYLVKRAEGEV